MSEIINITCTKRKLMEQVQALTEQLELERNKQMDMVIELALAAGAIENREQLLELERGTVLAMSEQLESVRADKERLDWLEFFNRENLDMFGNLSKTHLMWVMFSPIGHQGSARNIIDAAMKAGGAA